jgi:hypothetical protein
MQKPSLQPLDKILRRFEGARLPVAPQSQLPKPLSFRVGRKPGEEPAFPVSSNRFWQARFYDFNVRTEKKQIEKLRYIHPNPVARGLVASLEQWQWSSFRWYSSGEVGPVRINDTDCAIGRVCSASALRMGETFECTREWGAPCLAGFARHGIRGLGHPPVRLGLKPLELPSAG